MKSSIDPKTSELLTKEENELVLRLLGNKCQSLATAVIQLYVTQAPDHVQWIKKDTGIMCFVKDNYRRNYFFRMYCINRRMIIWEQELYNNLDYKSPYEYFHNFEADDCLAAFNFASEQEAYDMKKVVLEKIQLKRQRREERKARSIQGKAPQSRQVPNKPVFQSNTSLNQQIITYQQPKNKKKRHLTKADIGLPSDFKHVSHVGWDPNKGFDIDNVDEKLKEFFDKAGVSDKQLRDKDTRDFIYDFINTHGGLDAVKSEFVEQPVPKKNYPLPKTPNENTPMNPPPVPARTTVNTYQYENTKVIVTTEYKVGDRSRSQSLEFHRSAPPPPPGKTRPPPVVRGQPPPRPNHIPKAPESLPPSNAPAPPPPPPMSGLSLPPPPPMTGPVAEVPAPVQNDARAALLDSIKAGKTLKPVEQCERKTSVGDSRGDLLSEIRQGIELKPVANIPRNTTPVVTQNSLAAALSDALKNRALAIHSDSESSSEDDEEWD